MYLHRASSELKTHRESGIQLSRAEQVSQGEEVALEEDHSSRGPIWLGDRRLPQAPVGGRAGKETKAGTSQQPWTGLVAGFTFPQAASMSDLRRDNVSPRPS